MSYVYVIAANDAIKIGVSNDPNKRLASLQTAHFVPLTLLFTIRCKSEEIAYSVEAMLHEHYKAHRLKGEWFSLDPEVVMNDIEFMLQLGSLALLGQPLSSVEPAHKRLLQTISKVPMPTINHYKEVTKLVACIILYTFIFMLARPLVEGIPLTLPQLAIISCVGFYSVSYLVSR